MIQNGLTLAWRSLLKIRHSPEQLLDVILTPIIFVVLFVFLFGGAMAGRWQDYLVSLGVVLAFGVALGFRIRTGALPALAACLRLLAFALAVSWIPTLLGLLVRTPQTVQGIGFFVLFPLTFRSSIFVSASTLPGWLQAWVSVNPVTHLVDAARGPLRGGAVAEPALLTLVWMVGIVAVFAPVAIVVYRRRA